MPVSKYSAYLKIANTLRKGQTSHASSMMRAIGKVMTDVKNPGYLYRTDLSLGRKEKDIFNKVKK